jgi:hypothetical protein
MFAGVLKRASAEPELKKSGPKNPGRRVDFTLPHEIFIYPSLLPGVRKILTSPEPDADHENFTQHIIPSFNEVFKEVIYKEEPSEDDAGANAAQTEAPSPEDEEVYLRALEFAYQKYRVDPQAFLKKSTLKSRLFNILYDFAEIHDAEVAKKQRKQLKRPRLIPETKTGEVEILIRAHTACIANYYRISIIKHMLKEGFLNSLTPNELVDEITKRIKTYFFTFALAPAITAATKMIKADFREPLIKFLNQDFNERIEELLLRSHEIYDGILIGEIDQKIIGFFQSSVLPPLVREILLNVKEEHRTTLATKMAQYCMESGSNLIYLTPVDLQKKLTDRLERYYLDLIISPLVCGSMHQTFVDHILPEIFENTPVLLPMLRSLEPHVLQGKVKQLIKKAFYGAVLEICILHCMRSQKESKAPVKESIIYNKILLKCQAMYPECLNRSYFELLMNVDAICKFYENHCPPSPVLSVCYLFPEEPVSLQNNSIS